MSADGDFGVVFNLPKSAPAGKVTVTAEGSKGAKVDGSADTDFSVKAFDRSTITSDKADYAPGRPVALTGRVGPATGGQHRRERHLGQTWKRVVDVTVADDGKIIDTFSLPDYFVSDYDVTAVGNDSERVAETTFTDAQPRSGHRPVPQWHAGCSPNDCKDFGGNRAG